jgi:hypothetical protein
MIRCTAAQDTIMLGEHVSQLGNSTAQAGGLFHQVDFQTGIRQVECGAHTANAAAHNQSGGRFTSGNPGRYILHEYLPRLDQVLGCYWR